MLLPRANSNLDLKRNKIGGSEKLHLQRDQDGQQLRPVAQAPGAGLREGGLPNRILKRRRTADDEVDKIEVCATAPDSPNPISSNSGQ